MYLLSLLLILCSLYITINAETATKEAVFIDWKTPPISTTCMNCPGENNTLIFANQTWVSSDVNATHIKQKRSFGAKYYIVDGLYYVYDNDPTYWSFISSGGDRFNSEYDVSYGGSLKSWLIEEEDFLEYQARSYEGSVLVYTSCSCTSFSTYCAKTCSLPSSLKTYYVMFTTGSAAVMASVTVSTEDYYYDYNSDYEDDFDVVGVIVGSVVGFVGIVAIAAVVRRSCSAKMGSSVRPTQTNMVVTTALQPPTNSNALPQTSNVVAPQNNDPNARFNRVIAVSSTPIAHVPPVAPVVVMPSAPAPAPAPVPMQQAASRKEFLAFPEPELPPMQQGSSSYATPSAPAMLQPNVQGSNSNLAFPDPRYNEPPPPYSLN